MRSVHVLRRSGWAKEQFPSACPSSVEAAPDKLDPNSCYLNTIRFNDGTHMDRYGQYVKGTGGALTEVRGPIVDAGRGRARRAAADRRAEYLRRLGARAARDGEPARHRRRSRAARHAPADRRRAVLRPGAAGRRGAPPAGPRLYGGSELTDAGTQAAATFAQADNPRFRCETTSIVFDWTFDGPVNRITQNKDTIELLYGQMGLKRTIYMNVKEHPAGAKLTRAGHSIGRWDGDTLVVDTTHFLPGVLNAPVRNSDKLHVVERFTLDPNTMKLTRTYEADDPVYLKGVYKGSDVIGIADAPYAKDNCKEQGFINYSKQVQK